MAAPWLRARLSSAMVVLLWPVAGGAQEAEPAAPVEDASEVTPEVRAGVEAESSQLEAEPGPGEPPREVPPGPVTDDLKLFVARIARLRGVTDPALLENLERYYRQRRIGIEKGVVTTYRFIEGRPGRVVAESDFIGSYRSVTGSAYLDQFAPEKGGRVVGGVLAVLGGLMASIAVHEVLSGANCGGDYCSSEPAFVAGGGLLVGILGLVTLTMSEPSHDPTIHRIPLDTAETVVPIYNRALIERAIIELQRGNPGALEVSSHPLPPRRRAPSPPETTVGLGPRGLLVRF